MNKLNVFRTSIEFPAIEITQPIGTFYIGSLDCKDLVEIAKADIRRMEKNELDKYIGIQRRLSPTRVKAISLYVNNIDATFPTSIILAVPEECATWDVKTNFLKLESTENYSFEDMAVIIDGQHRVEGLKAFKGNKFQVNVSIFVGAPVAMQANIFATVNLAQTKVNKSLVYDLYDYEKKRSPQKSAHYITLALDTYQKSPLKNRIKRLGTATPGRQHEQLTQATVVENILRYISEDPNKDRNTYLLSGKIKPYGSEQLEKIIFGNLFANGHDETITEILFNYFKAVQKKWPTSWDDFDTQGNILPKSNGFIALMGALRPIYKKIMQDSKPNYVPDTMDFYRIIDMVKSLKDGKINTDIFKPGSSGSAFMKSLLLKDIFGVETESQIDFKANIFG
jgi:DGQHR domain-containing protein